MTLESILPQQALANVSLEDRDDVFLTPRGKHHQCAGSSVCNYPLYKKGYGPSSSLPTSLNRLMSSRVFPSSSSAASFLEASGGVMKALPTPKKVSFHSQSSLDEPDYGYGVAEPSMASSAEGRTAKRRNSKTPAMLLATLQSDLNFEGGRSAGAASPGGLPVKRRRFERRNSKTPTMLLATMQAALELDGCDDEDDDSTMEGSPVPPSTPDSPEGCPLDATEDVADDDDEDDDDDDNWEGGLEIAQELVKQLQRRRRPGLFG